MGKGNGQQPKVQQAGTWGLTIAELLAGVTAVQLVFQDSKCMNVTLLGIDRYDYLVKQENGAILAVPKHALRYVVPLPAKPKATVAG